MNSRLVCMRTFGSIVNIIRPCSSRQTFSKILHYQTEMRTFERESIRIFSSQFKVQPMSFDNKGPETTEMLDPFYFKDLTEEEAELMIKELNEAEQRKLKILQLEYDVFFSTGVKVPENMTNVRWLEVLKMLNTVSQRRKKYNYWRKIDMIELSNKMKKEKKLKIKAEREAEFANKIASGDSFYANKITMHIRESTMLKHYYSNLAYAMMFEPKIVFDLSWGNEMNNMEASNLVQQLMFCHGWNKVEKEPYHMVLCNTNKDRRIVRGLNKSFNQLDTLPITVSDEHYTELYPKDKLVYLSPNGSKTLETMDPDDIYIIGGLVDLGNEKQVSFARAKEEGIRSARFPLDKYLEWEQGSKSLTLDQVMQILLTFKRTKDWRKAFKHIPSRKVRGMF